MQKLKKGHNSGTTNLTKAKIQVCLFFILTPHVKFQDPISNSVLDCMLSLINREMTQKQYPSNFMSSDALLNDSLLLSGAMVNMPYRNITNKYTANQIYSKANHLFC